MKRFNFIATILGCFFIMATIREIYESVKSLNVHDIAKDAIDDTSEELIAVNQEQLLDGKDKDGRDTELLKWGSYSQDKRNNMGSSPFINRNFANYTLNYTGRMFMGMRLVFSGDTIDIQGQSDGFSYYKKNYPNYFGFNENAMYMEYYRSNFLYPNITLRIKQKLGL